MTLPSSESWCDTFFSYIIKDQINQKRNKLTCLDFIGIDLHQFGIVGKLK